MTQQRHDSRESCISHNGFTDRLVTTLSKHVEQNSKDAPNYFANKPKELITKADAHSFYLGTGHDVLTDSILPAIARAEFEVIFVTCFWAKSSSLSNLSDCLRSLSKNAVGRGKKVRVRICFSSLSLFQKLFHTRSLGGRVYEASEWSTRLGLPPAQELEGLDLRVKSVFLLPFSVMHPKFVVIDRRKAFLPSCNVSWEDWFEGCIALSGDVVFQFLRFWSHFWAEPEEREAMRKELERLVTHPKDTGPSDSRNGVDFVDGDLSSQSIGFSTFGVTGETCGLDSSRRQDHENDELSLPISSRVGEQGVPAVFLPSPHHVNPRFRFFPFQSPAPPPPTPLNCFLLQLLQEASREIYIQTPNLTSPPIIVAILDALYRGVDVHIVTSARLMVLEQLVTAGTTTTRCVKRIIRDYEKLWGNEKTGARRRQQDVERDPAVRPGTLRVDYFHPATSPEGLARREQRKIVQSHLKLTLVDQLVTVLGSGNMDRASWYTSQELGVAFFSSVLARAVKLAVEEGLKERTELHYLGILERGTST